MTTPFTLHGQEGAVRMLDAALAGGRLHHAYLVTGPAHVGKMTLAVQLAQALNCAGGDETCRRRIAGGQHADVRVVAVDSEATEGPRTVIGIEAVRDIISASYLRPYEGRTRVFIIDGAHRMSTDAANALLKVLEEPPPDVLLVLLTDDADAVLPTVRSRCQLLELRPLPLALVVSLLQREHGVGPEQAEVIGRLSRGCVGWAIEATRDPGLLAGAHQRLERIVDVISGGLEDRFAYADELARRFQHERAAGREELALWARWLRDVLLVQHGREEGITHVSWRATLGAQAAALSTAQTARWLQRIMETVDAMDRNANARLALEALMLDTPQVPAGDSAPWSWTG